MQSGYWTNLRHSSRAELLTNGLRALTAAVLTIAVGVYVNDSLPWRLAIDSPVMHYVVYLMHHGLHPYREIYDNNMPGAYMSEALGMRLFGGSDLSWRFYEFSLLGVIVGAMIVIARRSDWMAGVFAAGVFIVLHGADGPQMAAERELVITALLLAGYALLFEAMRRDRPWLTFGFGLACGAACSIKPTYLVLPVAVLGLVSLAVRRRGRPGLAFLLWGATGLLVAGLSVLGFLLANGSLAAFVLTLRLVLPVYAGTGKMTLAPLLARSLPHAVFALSLVGVMLVAANRAREWDYERSALAAGAAFGLFSFLLQGKGFVYHRYVTVAFVLLLVSLQLFEALRRTGWGRALAVVTTAAVLLLLVPQHVRAIGRIPASGQLELALEQDLRLLGGRTTLQGQVECLDMVYGCLNALYHLDIVENTGFTGDMTFFSAKGTPLVGLARDRFAELARQDPTGIFVISNELFSEPNNFDKVSRWPEFASYLARNYTLVTERRFPHERFGVPFVRAFPGRESDGYRLYVRKDSPLIARASSIVSSEQVAAR